jgi:phage terminase small subunit
VRRKGNDPKALTAREEEFCRQYLVDLNAAAAARRAGVAEKSANRRGYQMLERIGVKERISELQAERAERTRVKADDVIREIARLAFSDVRKLFAANGRALSTSEWDEDIAPAVASIEVVKRNLVSGDDQSDEVLKIRVWDKPKALEMLSKHLGLLNERIEHQGEITFRWVK